MFLIWRFGKFIKNHQIKTRPFKIYACMPMTLHIQIAKFEFHQYQMRAVMPNLMLYPPYSIPVCVSCLIGGTESLTLIFKMPISSIDTFY